MCVNGSKVKRRHLKLIIIFILFSFTKVSLLFFCVLCKYNVAKRFSFFFWKSSDC